MAKVRTDGMVGEVGTVGMAQRKDVTLVRECV